MDKSLLVTFLQKSDNPFQNRQLNTAYLGSSPW
jgi:hypothetical protein